MNSHLAEKKNRETSKKNNLTKSQRVVLFLDGIEIRAFKVNCAPARCNNIVQKIGRSLEKYKIDSLKKLRQQIVSTKGGVRDCLTPL
jgi:hypothetical protein